MKSDFKVYINQINVNVSVNVTLGRWKSDTKINITVHK